MVLHVPRHSSHSLECLNQMLEYVFLSKNGSTPFKTILTSANYLRKSLKSVIKSGLVILVLYSSTHLYPTFFRPPTLEPVASL